MANGLFNLKQVVQAVQQGGWSAQKTPAVEYLVVAGGATGGGSYSGGGGAGGLLAGLNPVPNGQTLLVTVGAGGGGTAGPSGNVGSNSVFGSITTTGGGGGSPNTGPIAASNGGSGGGSGSGGTFYVGGTGITGQGNNGGSNDLTAAGYASGGGGGAGTVGLNGSPQVGGNGGAGIASAINGTVTTYAGGGGGGARSGTAGSGGVGGGSAGSVGANNTSNASANTGGGSGGVGTGATSGNGGSGIVIVSYPDVYAAPTATTGSPTVSTSGSGSISFNGSSQYLSTSATQVIPATGDFTFEAWIYQTSFSGNGAVWGQGSGGDPGRSQIYITSLGVPTFTNGSSFVLSSSGTVSLNTWTYIAFVRSGSTGTFYINGTSAGSGSLSGISIQNTIFTVGATNPAWTTGYFTGYISNFRISDAARTISSTPTAPFNPSTTNTKLLLNTVSGAFLADASTNAYTFTNNGTSAWNALSPFSVTGYKNRVYTWTSSGSITF